MKNKTVKILLSAILILISYGFIIYKLTQFEELKRIDRADLLMEIEIEYDESIMGVCKYLKFIDNKKIIIKNIIIDLIGILILFV